MVPCIDARPRDRIHVSSRTFLHQPVTCKRGGVHTRGNVLALFTDHERSVIGITPKTQILNWLGEKMDDQLAVEGLLFRE